MRQATRAWSSPIESATARPRHRFGIDPRLLVFPIILPCGVALLFSHGWWQVAMAFVTLLAYTAAKVQWEMNPFFINDLQIELASPKTMADVK